MTKALQITVLPTRPLLAYDLQITDNNATLAAYLQELDEFMAKTLAPCDGCHLCCHERAPLTSLDISALAALLPQTPFPATAVVTAFGQIALLADGACDIFLRRPDNNCIFLDLRGFCREHRLRPLVCRSHFCLAKSKRAEALRQAIINQGLDELIRLLLSEEKQGAQKILPPAVCAGDYPPNALTNKKTPQEIKLQNLCDDQLWQELQQAAL